MADEIMDTQTHHYLRLSTRYHDLANCYARLALAYLTGNGLTCAYLWQERGLIERQIACMLDALADNGEPTP